MGCTASKLDNDDTVRRCKERRRLMKEAVYARHHLAAAHSDYCTSLRLTGSALVAFAAGEPLPVSHHAPGVLIPPPILSQPCIYTSKRTSNQNNCSNRIDCITSSCRYCTKHSPTLDHSPRQPPPSNPTRDFYTSNRIDCTTSSCTKPSVPPLPASPPPPMSTTSSHKQPPLPTKPTRRKNRIKLPHILSDSSFSSSPPPNNENFTCNARPNSTYSSTASQASSMWNWDNFHPPPSPPDSEYFEKLQNNKKKANENNTGNGCNDKDCDNYYKDSSFTSNAYIPGQIHQFRHPFSGRNEANKRFDDSSSYSRYSDNTTNGYSKPGQNKRPNLKRWESEEEEGETEREEVECSEWGDRDHFSSTSVSSDEDEKEEDLRSRTDFGSTYNEAANVGNVDSASNLSSKPEKVTNDGKSTDNLGNGKIEGVEDCERKVMVRHKDLEEIVAAVREYFDKAASAGEQVSEMLETGRAELDRNFNQLRKTVYHSNGMLSNLSSRWTSKPPLGVKYRFDPNPVEQSGSRKSLFSTLDRLLAWEKKLYQEVKAREGVKIEHEKKLSALQSQEYRGGDEAKLDKTKASIKRLQSLISVTSQAVSATSAAIVGLRDSQLVPQLIELCHGFMYMWRSMNQYHETQNDIVQQVQGLVNRTTKGEATSDLHRQATRDLESSLSSWHSSFCRLIKFHRNFIHSLHGWFKLTLLPANTEQTNNSNSSAVFSFFDEWKLALDRIPDAVPSEAIKSFINVVRSISLKQMEELKIKKLTDTASKGLEKKASSLRSIEKKYYQSYSTVGIGVPDSGPDNGHFLDARDPLADKKAELSTCQRRVEDEMLNHSRAVDVTKAMTLNNIQTGLPGVFQAMTSFSALIAEALEKVCASSYAI